MQTSTLKIFIAFAKEDRDVRDKLLRQMNLVKNREGWEIWASHEIKAGAVWNEEIKARLAGSEVVVLLMSSSFFNSKYIIDVELPVIVEKHRVGNCHIVPVLVRHCLWKDTDFGGYAQLGDIQALPAGENPIVSKGNWDSEEEAYMETVQGLKVAIQSFKDKMEKLAELERKALEEKERQTKLVDEERLQEGKERQTKLAEQKRLQAEKKRQSKLKAKKQVTIKQQALYKVNNQHNIQSGSSIKNEAKTPTNLIDYSFEILNHINAVFRDGRDGNSYKVIKLLDGNWWFAENFRLSCESHVKILMPSNEENIIGKLYLQKQAIEMCPIGWHLPTDLEWKKMIESYGGFSSWIFFGGKRSYKTLIDGGSSGFNAVLGGESSSIYPHKIEELGKSGQYLSNGSIRITFYKLLETIHMNGANNDLLGSVRYIKD